MPPPRRPLLALPESAIVRRAATLGLATLVSVLWATPALAHPALIETVPGAGYAVTTPPEAVSVSFNEPVTPVGDALTLQRADGTPLPLDVSLSPDGTSLRGVPQ